MNTPTGSDFLAVAWSTHAWEVRLRHAFWNDFVCQRLLAADCRVAGEEPLKAQVTHAPLRCAEGVVAGSASQIDGTAQSIGRAARHVAGARSEHLVLMIQREGKCFVSQGDAAFLMRPGDVAMYSSTQPSQLTFPEKFSQTVVVVDVSGIQNMGAVGAGLAARRIAPSPLTSLLGHAAEALTNTSTAELADSGRREVEQAVLGLVKAAVSSSPQQQAQGQRNLCDADEACDGRAWARAAWLHRIQDHARRHLLDPTLSVASVCAALHISPAQLHRVFQNEPKSMMAWVWAERIQAAQCDLANPAMRHLSIADIAYACAPLTSAARSSGSWGAHRGSGGIRHCARTQRFRLLCLGLPNAG